MTKKKELKEKEKSKKASTFIERANILCHHFHLHLLQVN